MKIKQVSISPSTSHTELTPVLQLYVYPIKSLRGVALPAASLCAQGLAYDRRYVLLRPAKDGNRWTNMFVGVTPEMALFHCAISSPTVFTVTYHTPCPPVSPPTPSQQTALEIPFEPSSGLDKVHVSMHTDPAYPAYRMPESFNKWFSECFGYEVILAYLGDGLGIKQQDEKAQYWISSITPIVPAPADDINFSDGAALLVASETSLEDLHPRLGGEKAVLEKFRPNIVVDGSRPWDEDFWGELTIPRLGARIILTSNCARCTSINVDLDKGRMGEGESGKLLKKMMRDRRVDLGNKWTPVFGRYGFPTQAGELRVGDEVAVSVRNSDHTVWSEWCWQTSCSPRCNTDKPQTA